MLFNVQLYNFLFFLNFSKYDVLVKPGDTLLILTLIGNSTAIHLVRASNAPFDDPYADNSSNPLDPTIELRFTIEIFFFFVNSKTYH